MKKISLLIGVASLLFLAGCSQYKTTSAIPVTTEETPATAPIAEIIPTAEMTTSKSVNIANFQFAPASMGIAVGDTITRTNDDEVAHSVVADDGLFKSAALQQGQSFSYTFTQAGAYTYHCVPHLNMKGTITVK